MRALVAPSRLNYGSAKNPWQPWSIHRLQIYCIHFNGYGALKQVERKDEARPILPADNNAFQALEGTALDLHAAPNTQVRIWLDLEPLAQAVLNRLDVFFLQKNTMAT